MTTKYAIDPDGSLTITDEGAPLLQFDQATKTMVPVLDKSGQPVLSQTRRSIQPSQIDAHRRDSALDAALPASIKAQLDAAKG